MAYTLFDTIIYIVIFHLILILNLFLIAHLHIAVVKWIAIHVTVVLQSRFDEYI